jgi:hypothetical protein
MTNNTLPDAEAYLTQAQRNNEETPSWQVLFTSKQFEAIKGHSTA